MKTKLILLLMVFVICLLGGKLSASVITGSVSNTDGTSLAYASIYIKNTSYGVSCDARGNYLLETNAGVYTIVYSYIGYITVERDIILEPNVKVELNVVLEVDRNLLGTIEIISNTKDKAKEIVAKCKEKRKIFYDNIQSFKCKTYVKTSLEKDNLKRLDSIRSVSKYSSMDQHLKKEKMNLIESVSSYYYEKSNKYKEIILAQHDYSEMKAPPRFSVSIGADFSGRSNIVSSTYLNSNPYIIYENILSGDYNFYKNNISLPKVVEKPLLSPIANGSSLSYTYDYEGSFIEDSIQIHRIKIKPRFGKDALFTGMIYIQEGTWALIAVDLSINQSSLIYCEEFRIIQNYAAIEKDHYLPIRREIIYTINHGKDFIMGNTRIQFDEYIINPLFEKGTFTNEIIQYHTNAIDKKQTYWDSIRPITLRHKELLFIHRSDSIRRYFESDIYKERRDSIFNNINIWSFLVTGLGYRNTFEGTEYYVDPLLAQILPFGIGGYRHRLGGYYYKRYESGKSIEWFPSIDYGFNNNDLKGNMGIAYTYWPLRYAKTSISAGDNYEMINNFESYTSVFSRNNYVNTKWINVSQRIEIFNGLYGELSFKYADQKPIIDIELSEWSKDLFGDLNQPQNFEPYRKTEIRLELQYRINQKYLIKNNRKIILETKYPQLSFVYRKGLKDLLGSEVDFDYIEFGVSAKTKLARWGNSRWEFLAGSFINKKNLRLLEYKYFRGSDIGLFTDPLQSFQLLGPTLNTSNGFIRAAYMHHFNGTILNKIPIINKLKLGLAGGVGTLVIQDIDYRHAEIFLGLERVVRIKKLLLRLGVFGITSDDNLEKAKYTFKFGVTAYNPFTREWGY